MGDTGLIPNYPITESPNNYLLKCLIDDLLGFGLDLL
jgi:hypothetical protein